MRPYLPLLFLAACGTDPTFEGQVVDIWNQPVADVTVMMVGVANQRRRTDASGYYILDRIVGEQELKIGRKGYVQTHQTFDILEDGTQQGPTFKLYKKPVDDGFYVVGPTDYLMLDGKSVTSVGNALESFHGLVSAGDVETEGSKLSVLFHTDLKMDQLMRLDMELHQTKYINEAPIPGPLGSQTMASIQLFVSEKEIPIEIKPLGSRTDYLITTTVPLESGTYAFHTQKLLTPKDDESFSKIPEALRIAFPLTVRN
ncbi:MAG: carboxypeptidase regulatory-like domain-containing protein [Proteobacteria bacterium]|nr:carboxypeptidase regulatory-like domain-containing protein [Pseudomonadota bacterium]